MTLLRVEDLVHRYDGSSEPRRAGEGGSDGDGDRGGPAVDDVSLAVDRGEFVALAGRNGSGKTTLVRHWNALLAPDAGSVVVDGVEATEDPTRARSLVGMVFQDPRNQIVAETVVDDVAFGPENLGLSRGTIEDRVTDAMARCGIADLADRSPHTLSGGEVARVAIAGVLAMEPDLVVLDEPLASLDAPGRDAVLGALDDLVADGVAVVAVTHDLEPLLGRADRLVVMEDGSVVADGPLEAVLRDGVERYGVSEPYPVRLLDAADREAASFDVQGVLDALVADRDG